MTKREQIVAKAREYIDTPFHHEGRVKGAGVDCIGLLVGVAHELGIPVEDKLTYGKFGEGAYLRAALERCLDPVKGDPRPGDLLLMQLGEEFHEPQHMAIVTDIGIVHAVNRGRSRKTSKVVEHRLTKHFRDAIVSVWSYRGID